MERISSLFGKKAIIAIMVACISILSFGQKTAVKKQVKPIAESRSAVTQIDEVALKKLLVPNGRPLLINFWATWCDPCREEFPELVKIDAEYKGKIDFITISLDDLVDINTAVPKFLSDMKAGMPAYLLRTADEEGAMRSVSPEWAGGLPFTILFDENGKTKYFRQGKVRPDILRGELSRSTMVARSN